MAKRIMKEEQIIDVIWGATLFGGGGGGSMEDALDLLEKYKKDHPETPIEVTVYDVDEMDPGSYAATTAAMGAPTAFKKVDLSAYITNAFATLQEVAARMDPPRTLEYSIAVELGGLNTFVPILVSLAYDVPLIDADGSGRAVPALNTLLLSINGCATSPLAMADDENNKITIELTDPYNANLGEEIGRSVCGALGDVAGLSNYMVKQKDIKERLPCGTITLCEKVGQVLRSCAEGKGDVFTELSGKGIVECKKFCVGKVTKTENLVEKGFDYGKIVVSSGDDEWTLHYQNENIVTEKNREVVMTVPDITCTYDAVTGRPLTNADIKEGMDIVIGAIKADEKWWKNPSMFEAWKPILDRVGYTGKNVPFGK